MIKKNFPIKIKHLYILIKHIFYFLFSEDKIYANSYYLKYQEGIELNHKNDICADRFIIAQKLAELVDNDNILDVGSGRNELEKNLVNKKLDVIKIDFSKNSMRFYPDHDTNFILNNFFYYDFKRSFDKIFILDFIYRNNIKKTLKKAVTILNKNGIIIISLHERFFFESIEFPKFLINVYKNKFKKIDFKTFLKLVFKNDLVIKYYYENNIHTSHDLKSRFYVLKKGNSENKNKLLISFPATLGDVISLTGLLPKIKEKYYQYDIYIKSNYPELFFFNPYCKPLFTELKADKIINLTTQPDKNTRTKHIVDILAQSLEINISEIERKPEVYIKDFEREIIDIKFPLLNKKPFIVLAPFSRWPSKNWSIKNWYELVDNIQNELDVNIIQLGVENDPYLGYAYDFRGKTSVRESAIILEKAQAIITVDNGIHHLAVAVNKKCITLFGPLKAENIMYENYTIPIQNNNVCHGCYNDFTRSVDFVPVYCPKNTYECMLTVGSEFVYKTLRIS